MSSMDEERRDRYWRAVREQDRIVDDKITSIRRREDAGELTPAEGAAERIAALETHLAAIRELRQTHLGGT